MANSFFRVFVGLLSFFVVVAYCQGSCSYSTTDSSTGKTFNYDLSPLTITDGIYYSGTTQNGNDVYYANVCGEVSGVCGDFTDPTAVCQLSYGNPYNLGLLSTQVFTDGVNGPATGVTLTYSDGTACGSYGNRKTIENLVCGAGATVLESVVENPECTYTITISSPLACPTCFLTCGAGERCCADKTIGQTCYDPAGYWCTLNPAGGLSLCPINEQACGAACYSPSEYCCVDDELTQIEFCESAN